MTESHLTAEALLSALPIPPVRISGDGVTSRSSLTLLSDDSRRASVGALFVCIRGARSDGHAYLPAAYAAGCRTFLVEHAPKQPLPPDADVYLSDNTRRDLSYLAAAYYGHPARALSVVGITGTKGKTTTALMCHHICQRARIPSGYIGTAGIFYGDVRRPTQNSTPAPLILQKALSEMLSCGVQTVFLEVSSQALMQERVAGIPFPIAALTNIFPDHIGPTEHPNFAHYTATKRRLLTEYAPATVVAWGDDPHSGEMLRDLPGRPIRCGTHPTDAFRLIDMTPTLSNGLPAISFVLSDHCREIPVCLPLPGQHNVANAMLSIAITTTLGISPLDAADALSDLSIPDRYDILQVKDALVAIDYAHNGAALRAALESLRPYTKGRLKCLFGSVGERSQSRRADLGRVASELSDYTYLTADDPASEPVEAICAEIAAAFSPAHPYTVIPDRAAAIRHALEELAPGDLLLLAGKGNDQTQHVGNEFVAHNDHSVVLSYLDEITLLGIH